MPMDFPQMCLQIIVPVVFSPTPWKRTSVRLGGNVLRFKMAHQVCLAPKGSSVLAVFPLTFQNLVARARVSSTVFRRFFDRYRRVVSPRLLLGGPGVGSSKRGRVYCLVICRLCYFRWVLMTSGVKRTRVILQMRIYLLKPGHSRCIHSIE